MLLFVAALVVPQLVPLIGLRIAAGVLVGMFSTQVVMTIIILCPDYARCRMLGDDSLGPWPARACK